MRSAPGSIVTSCADRGEGQGRVGMNRKMLDQLGGGVVVKELKFIKSEKLALGSDTDLPFPTTEKLGKT